jgi:hypothetical protein
MARVSKQKNTTPRGGAFAAIIVSIAAMIYILGKKATRIIPGLSKVGLQEIAAITVSIGVVYLVSKHHAALQAYFKK